MTRPNSPGVDVTDTASVSRQVMPASTHLTAFVGVFPQGPVDRAVLVTSWMEFKQLFGDLDVDSTLAVYSVWLFFANGGEGAWLVRLDGATGASGLSAHAVVAPAAAPVTKLTITANSPGSWAEGLDVSLRPCADTTRCDFVVRAIPTLPQVLETISDLAVVGSDGKPVPAAVLAEQISVASQYVTAAPSSQSSPVKNEARLTGGQDVAWTDVTLAAQIETQLVDGALLDRIRPQLFNLLCIPDAAWLLSQSAQRIYGAAQTFCAARGALLIVDPPTPSEAGDPPSVLGIAPGARSAVVDSGRELITEYGSFLGPDKTAAAIYYPWVQIADPLTQQPRLVPPSGAVAGVYARSDIVRGVWKAPAGAEASLENVSGLADLALDDAMNGNLNALGINCLRTFPVYGTVVWGSRTLAGGDLAQSAFRYVSVRRLTDFIEQSLQQSLRWAAFEPNAPALWASLSLEAKEFMSGLYAAGAFAGAGAAEAYQVQCDASPADIQNGVVNLSVAFAPVQPAQFVVLDLQIAAGAPAR
jgi:phage tail sheath protein FI